MELLKASPCSLLWNAQCISLGLSNEVFGDTEFKNCILLTCQSQSA